MRCLNANTCVVYKSLVFISISLPLAAGTMIQTIFQTFKIVSDLLQATVLLHKMK